MKDYPSIPGASEVRLGEKGIAFYKYDGSNLRWEWSKKRGFYKFGTRTRLFDVSDEQFGDAISLFFEGGYASSLEHLIKQNWRVDSAIAYTEYFGFSSFAGNHIKDESKRLALIDLNIHRQGFLSPREFTKLPLSFLAEVVYDGTINKSFVEAVKTNTVENFPLNEGVVIKYGAGHKLFRVKVKTAEYLEKLKFRFGNEWEKYA